MSMTNSKHDNKSDRELLTQSKILSDKKKHTLEMAKIKKLDTHESADESPKSSPKVRKKITIVKIDPHEKMQKTRSKTITAEKFSVNVTQLDKERH